MRSKFKKLVVTRKLPINIKHEQKSLFEHELQIKINKPKIKTYKNIYYYNEKFYKFRTFEIYSKHWRMYEYGWKHKIKLILKNIIKGQEFNLNNKPLKVIKKASHITDEKSHMYFHWMFDAMSRLELLENKNYLRKQELAINENIFNKPFVGNTLKFFNTEVKVLEMNQLYKFKNLTIPFHLANSGNYNPDFVQQLRTRYLSGLSSKKSFKSSKRIWISRQDARIRKIANFSEIETILKNNGFKIVTFENIENFSEHIAQINNAEILGGIHGAGLSNMIFLNPGSKVVEVRKENDDHNNAYFSLTSALGLDYYYVLAKINNQKEKITNKNYIDEFYHSNYYVDPETLRETIERL